MFVAWRAVRLNAAEHFAQSRLPADAETALHWDQRHPVARLILANDARVAGELDQAKANLRAAIRANPAEGRSYASLGLLLEQQGQFDEAVTAMEMAVRMTPQRVDVRAEAAAFSFRRGEIRRGMAHLDVVLSKNIEARAIIFPELLRMIDQPENLKALAEVVGGETVWWAAFVNYAAVNASQLEVLRRVFEVKAGENVERASEDGLRAYLDRLKRDGFWTEAYLTWLNRLDKRRLASVNNVFNGGFEDPPTNLGFDWIIDRNDAVLVQTAPSFGVGGSRALQLVFRGPRVRFRHVRQHLMLAPGDYLLRGRVRPESLESQQGLQWAIYCEGSTEALVLSERFVGTDQWRNFSTPFVVPRSDCQVQNLQLELAGRVALDFVIKGGIWFDDIAIERQSLD